MSKYFMLRNSLDISEEDTQSGIIQSMYKLLLRIKKYKIDNTLWQLKLLFLLETWLDIVFNYLKKVIPINFSKDREQIESK